MQTRIITSTEEFYRLKDHWQELEQQDPDSTYYSTFEFNKTWWDVFKETKDKSLFIICVYNNGKIVGIAPLIIEKHKKNIFSWNVLKFLGWGDYLGVIINRKENSELTIIKEMFKAIENFKDKWDRIQLTHIKHNSFLAFYLLKSREYNENFKYLTECPCVYFNKYESLEKYKITYYVQRIRKLNNKLMREKNYKFKVIHNKEGDHIYDLISGIHKKEQKFLIHEKNRKERRSLFLDKDLSKFVKNIYKNNSKVFTFILEDNNEKVMCYDTCYLYKRVLHCWNSGFDTDLQKYSVGKILDYEIIKYIFKNRVADVFDFGAGRYNWKFQLTKDFIFDYKLDRWNLESKKGRILHRINELKNNMSVR